MYNLKKKMKYLIRIMITKIFNVVEQLIKIITGRSNNYMEFSNFFLIKWRSNVLNVVKLLQLNV